MQVYHDRLDEAWCCLRLKCSRWKTDHLLYQETMSCKSEQLKWKLSDLAFHEHFGEDLCITSMKFLKKQCFWTDDRHRQLQVWLRSNPWPPMSIISQSRTVSLGSATNFSLGLASVVPVMHLITTSWGYTQVFEANIFFCWKVVIHSECLLDWLYPKI